MIVDRLIETEREKGASLKIEDIHDQVAGVYPKVMTEGDMEAGAWSCGMVAGLIHDIGRSVLQRGFLDESQIVHYKTHEVLDVEHAEGFYGGLYAPYANHPRQAYQIQQGLELGAYAFLRLYEDLYRQRGRRWQRTVRGPHSLADGWYVEPGL